MKLNRMAPSALGLFLVALFGGGNAFAQGSTFANPVNSALMANPTSSATTSADSGWKAQWRMLMSADNDVTDETARRYIITRFDFNFRYLLDDTVFLKVTPTANLQSGASETFDGTTVEQNQIYFSEASVTWKPVSSFLAKAGALDQSEMHSSLLVGQRPFPGAATGVALGDRNFRYGLFATTAIPTSVSLTTYDGQREKPAGLHSVQARLEWTNGPLWNASVVVGGWMYTDLASGTANESSLLGNSTIPLSDSERLFAYNYQGLEGTARFKFPMGRNDGEIDATGIENTAAPAGHNMGWKTRGRVRVPVSSRLDILGGGLAYHLESDAAVASFVDPDYSGTNRNGYALEAGVAFGKHKIRLIGRAGVSDLITQNDPQSRDEFVLFKLESDYASF